MKVASYQAPLLPSGSFEAIALISRRVQWCETNGVRILCCPEAVLGGLADHAPRPAALAMTRAQLAGVVSPLASDTVTTIVGFSEIDVAGRLFNAAAVFHRGEIAGVYRKRHPAINRSVYTAGDESPVFTIAGLTFGILICNDSNFAEPARIMVSRGAAALFIPSNNGLPPDKADVKADAMRVDVSLARTHHVPVIRADVAGRADGRVSVGSSWIVDAHGVVLRSAPGFSEDLIAAEIEEEP